MNRIELTIKALSPLAIGRKKPGGSVSEAESYIPGSVIRGAIAGLILRQANQHNQDLSTNSNDFQSLFLGEDPAIFLNAYPAVARHGDTLEVITDPIQTLPNTAISSKTNPGFKPKGHGVFDTLIDRFCAQAYGWPYDPCCPKDRGRMEMFKGWYSKGADDHYRTHQASTRLLTRVGINRRRATAQDEQLFSLEVLNESFPVKDPSGSVTWLPMIFRSAILLKDEELAAELAGYINRFSGQFRLGGSISRGLGQVEIQAKTVANEDDLNQRIKTFHTHFQDRWKLWSELGTKADREICDHVFFTINLESEGIFTDQWRRTTVISAAMLQKFAQVEDPSLRLEVAYSSYDYRSGWNSAWGLMKDMELVTNPGAVYLFSTTQLDPWNTPLAALELRGVGDRTCEGFGQIRICHEFHSVYWRIDDE